MHRVTVLPELPPTIDASGQTCVPLDVTVQAWVQKPLGKLASSQDAVEV
jgi:hypothetical protein